MIHAYKSVFLLFLIFSLLFGCGGDSNEESSKPQISVTAPIELWTDSGIYIRVNASGFDMNSIVYSVDGATIDENFAVSGIYTSEPSTQNFDIGNSGISFNATDALGNRNYTTWRYKVNANISGDWQIPNLTVNVPQMPDITNNFGQIIPSRNEIIDADVYQTIKMTRSGRVYLSLMTSSYSPDFLQQHFISESCAGDGSVDLNIFSVELVCQHKNHAPERFLSSFSQIVNLDQDGNPFITDNVEHLRPYRYTRSLVLKFDQSDTSKTMQMISTSSNLPSTRFSIFDEVPPSSFTLSPLESGDVSWMEDYFVPELLPGIYYSADKSFQLKSNGDIIDADNSILFDENSSQYLSYWYQSPTTYGDCDVYGSVHSDPVWNFSSNDDDELPFYDLTMNIQNCTVPIQENGFSKNKSLEHASAHLYWSRNGGNWMDGITTATIQIQGQVSNSEENENLTYGFIAYRVCDEFNVPTNFGNQAGVVCPF